MTRPVLLFSDHDLRAILENAEKRLKAAIDSYDADSLLSAHVEDVAQYFVESAGIVPLRAPRRLCARRPGEKSVRREGLTPATAQHLDTSTTFSNGSRVASQNAS